MLPTWRLAVDFRRNVDLLRIAAETVSASQQLRYVESPQTPIADVYAWFGRRRNNLLDELRTHIHITHTHRSLLVSQAARVSLLARL